jgi:DNA polymerase-3 subunit gamma/tau
VDPKPRPYQVIARKYRPQTFSSVVGQEAIVTTLKNALKHCRLAHAYLFCGCRGTGKTTLARVFAKTLNCSHPTEDGEPCNECSSCQEINAGRSLDVLEIDGASNRGIDDIRQINETIGYAPSAVDKYKIYIIDEVHMLTKEAFNALLKTLEEPPERVKFFFATTEPHKVLPTIISRCQRFDLGRIPFEALKKKLAWIAQDLNVPCEEDVFSLIANLSEGSLRDAESLLDQVICYAEHPITLAKVSSTLGIVSHSTFFSLDQAFDKQTLSLAFELAGDIFSSGKDLSYFIDQLIEHYRCILKLKVSAPLVLPTARLKEQYTASQALYTEEQALYILDFLIHWQQQIGKTPFKRITLETILLHIIRSKYRLSLPALIKRLHALEEQLAAAPKDKETAPVIMQPAEPVAAQPEPYVVAEPAFEPAPVVASLQPVAPVPAQPEPSFEPAPAVVSLQPMAPVSSQEPSFEEVLMKKIQDKIEAAPPPVEEPSAKPTFPLFSKAKWEAMASEQEIAAPPKIEEAVSPASPIKPVPHSSRYDTLTRFAAVELEGTLKKENNNG